MVIVGNVLFLNVRMSVFMSSMAGFVLNLFVRKSRFRKIMIENHTMKTERESVSIKGQHFSLSLLST